VSTRVRRPARVAAAPPQRRGRTAALLALCCGLVYLANLRPPGPADSIPARLIPFSLLREGNLDLDEFHWLTRDDTLPYFLRRTTDGHVVSRYPLATALVAAPLAVPFVWWSQHHRLQDDDIRFRLATLLFERFAAALMMALSVALVYLALCHLTTSPTAIGIALVYALGSNTWSTSSQSLWQHGLAALSLAGLSLSLLRLRARPSAIAATIAGALASAGVLARPTMLIFAVLALLYIWQKHRSRVLAFALLPAIGALGLLAYNLRTMSSILGGYADINLGLPSPRAAAGLLISPNRGLFIFTPATLLALPAMLRWRSPRSPWLPYLGAGCVAYLVFYSSFHGWWGGATYGPRFLVDILPALALLSVPAVEALIATTAGRAVATVLAACSVLVQLIGVYGGDYNDWNERPRVVNDARVWDWRDPQILRTLRLEPWGFRLAPFVWQAWTDPTEVMLRELPPQSVNGDIAVENPTPITGRAAGTVTLSVRLSNRSDAIWPGFSDYGFLDCLVVFLWTPADTGAVAGSIPLPRNLAPGDTVNLSQRIRLPPLPGSYQLKVALVQTIGLEAGIFADTSTDVAVRVQ
jgi:hypothetical protein